MTYLAPFAHSFKSSTFDEFSESSRESQVNIFGCFHHTKENGMAEKKQNFKVGVFWEWTRSQEIWDKPLGMALSFVLSFSMFWDVFEGGRKEMIDLGGFRAIWGRVWDYRILVWPDETFKLQLTLSWVKRIENNLSL